MRKHIDRLKKETTSYYNLQLKKTCGKWTWKHLLCIWQLVSSNCLAFFTEDFMKRNLLVVFVVIPISRGRSIEALCIIINALWTDHATKRSRVLPFFPFHLSNWIVLETNFFRHRLVVLISWHYDVHPGGSSTSKCFQCHSMSVALASSPFFASASKKVVHSGGHFGQMGQAILEIYKKQKTKIIKNHQKAQTQDVPICKHLFSHECVVFAPDPGPQDSPCQEALMVMRG